MAIESWRCSMWQSCYSAFLLMVRFCCILWVCGKPYCAVFSKAGSILILIRFILSTSFTTVTPIWKHDAGLHIYLQKMISDLFIVVS